MNRTYRRLAVLMVLLALGASDLWAQRGATLRGFVTDDNDGQPLQGVNIVLDNDAGAFLGAVTDGDGFFLFSRIPAGSYRFRASFIGYVTHEQIITLADGGAMNLSFALVEDQALLEEVVVEAEREGGAASVTAGLQTIRPRDIEMVPSPDVSGDLVTYLTAMPGIVSLGDRGGQLFIRGGEPSHNLALIDGMHIFQPFHILGFYSAFPSDIMSSAEVYAGGFGSRYSGRLSSVIDVRTRNGNKKSFRETVSIAPFVSTLMVEGPLKRDRVSFLVSARQSVIDQVAARYVNQELPYTFGDFFGKTHIIFSPTHQVSVSGLYTYDQGALDGSNTEDEQIYWSNRAYGLRYLVAPPQLPILAEIMFSVSSLEAEEGPRDEPTRASSIGGFNFEVNFTNFGSRGEVGWGFFLRSPELVANLNGLFQDLNFTQERYTNVGAYFEPDIEINPTLRVRPGLVTQFAGQQGFSVEPRLRVIKEMVDQEWSAAAGLYRQDLVGINDRRDATNIFTAWAETPVGRSAWALHTLVGYRVTPTQGLELSAEAFYKYLWNLSIAEWTAFPRFSTRLQPATGNAVGVDLRVEIQRPTFYAFVNYGLGIVRYEAMQESLPIWFGTDRYSFRPPHDRRHQVNALVRVMLGKFELAARWNFGSGLPYNQVRAFDGFILMDGPVDVRAEPGSSRVIYDRPFAGVLPTYHRLDLTLERVFSHGGHRQTTLQLGVINTYNRTNLFALDVLTLRQINQLPVIPTAGIKVEL